MGASSIRSFRRYAVPLLLLLVASFQIHAVHRRGLSSWRGGGFGMYGSFSPNLNDLWWTDLESGETRRYVKEEGEATEDAHRAALRPFLTYINEKALREYHASLPAAERERVRLEVLRLDFDPRTGVLSRKRMIEAGPERRP